VATAIEDILSKRFMYTPPGYVNIIIIFLLSILPAFLMLEHHPLRGNILVFVSAVVYFTACLLLFRFGIKIDMSVPLLSMLASSISVGASNFVRVFAERKKFFTMAITDGLTGLYNIKYFKMLLDTEIMFASLDPSKKFAIVMSDVDHFKKFNDTYGHQVGDLVLKEVAGILKAGLRSTDIIARYGGEEMIMLLMGNDIKGAQIIGEKIRKAMEDHVVRDEKNSYKVTSSFGIATYRPNDTVDSIIKRADEALYQAKEQGRNKVCVEAAA
jgi:diguanylate cyclase (GGDEF)-like protein